MKNKILKLLLIIFFLFTKNICAQENNQIFFEVDNIEISEEGNVYKGLNGGVIKTDSGLIITAENFIYKKNLNFLSASGNVKVEDKIKNYLLYADSIEYFKNEETIITNDNSKAYGS